MESLYLEPRSIYDKAIVGETHDNRIVYNLDKIIDILMYELGDMGYGDAYDYFEYNILRGGNYTDKENSPVYINSITLSETYRII